ncbi:phage tail spike protein [Streptococcus gordonii]|uniref:phage tail spike protein n=1 Tax=Streptococcus gordonii TaxID=1302 RepID=UPI0022841B44|nr:phage tail spike protein [Streptococcus gordonii]MCY7133679.1 gp58-like family protein [Streptococcus gordonii]
MIYLFNHKEELIRIVPKSALISVKHSETLTDTHYVSDRLEIEMEDIPDDVLSESAYVAIQKEDAYYKYHLFFIANVQTYDHIIHLDCVQSGIEELRKSYVEDSRITQVTAVQATEYLLQNTNWQLRYKPETEQKNLTFYFLSVFDGLLRVCDKFNLEMQFFVEISYNKIGARYIDLKKRIGDRTGQRVTYGHNALKIIKEEERAEFYTAVIGLGNSEIVSVPEANDDRRNGYSRKKNFKDLVWTKPQNPLNKPKGIPYLELAELTEKYGIKSDTGMRPRIGKVDFDTDDPNELIQMTYDYLIANAHPKVTFSTTTAYLKGEIGDTVRVVRPDMNIDYETRIFEIKRERLSNEVIEIKLGDQISQSDGLKELQQSQSESDLQNSTVELSKKRALDFLDGAGGFNRNWYRIEDPPTDKVKVGDLWYKPDPDHEGYHIMYTWDGEHWIELVRTFGNKWADQIKDDFKKEVDKINQAIATQEQKAQEALTSSGASASAVEAMQKSLESLKALPDTLEKKIADYKQSTDGRFANLAQQFADKIEFQRVQETSKLYERVLGSSENSVSDKIARLVMSNEIFQTEVRSISGSGGPNMIRNSRADDGLNHWETQSVNFQNHGFYFNGQKRMFALTGVSWMKSPRFLLKKNTAYMLNFLGFNSGNTKSLRVYIRKRKKGETQDYTSEELLFNPTTIPFLSHREAVKKSFSFNTGDFDEGYLYIENGGPNNGADKWSGVFLTEFDLYEGTADRKWQPAPEDSETKIDAVSTKVTQLAGSWAVQNLKSNGDIVSQINAVGSNVRIQGEVIHLNGRTLIDDAVIKSSMIANISADKITAGTLDAGIVNLINLNANNIVSGKLQGLTMRGGMIESLNGELRIDLQKGIWTSTGEESVIRRIEGTSSSQFIKLKKGGFISEHFRDTNSALMIFGTNHDKTERHDNETFAGIRIWSGTGGGYKESLTEFVGDRVLIYNNGKYRSPWNFHGNTEDGKTYILPMNQNGVKHFIGRGDFFLEGIYSRNFYLSGGVSVGDYLWDLLTCFGQLVQNNVVKDGAKTHITGVLRKRGYKI